MTCYAKYGNYIIANAHSLEACYEDVLSGHYSKRVDGVKFYFRYENGTVVSFPGTAARILLLESKMRDFTRVQAKNPVFCVIDQLQ